MAWKMAKVDKTAIKGPEEVNSTEKGFLSQLEKRLPLLSENAWKKFKEIANKEKIKRDS